MSVLFFFDSSQGWQQGIIRGMGKIMHASFGGIVAYYIISVPFGYYCAFHLNCGVLGLWYGMFCGMVTLALYQ